MTFLALCLSSPVFAEDCSRYEPAVTTVSGVISIKEYFGPPNYGENPDTDSKEKFYFIALDKPLCVNASSEYDSAENNINSMEMVYAPSDYPFNNAWLGKRVSVSGTLFHAQTAHHHTPVLITVTETHILKAALRH